MEKSNWNIKGYAESVYDFNIQDYENSSIKEFSQYEVLFNHEESGIEILLDSIKVKFRNYQIEKINDRKIKRLCKAADNLRNNKEMVMNSECGYKPVA